MICDITNGWKTGRDLTISEMWQHVQGYNYILNISRRFEERRRELGKYTAKLAGGRGTQRKRQGLSK